MRPAVNGARSSVKQRQGTKVNRRQFIVGEVVGDEVTTVVFLSSTRTQEYPRLGRWLTGASSSASMADDGGRAVVRRSSPAMVGSGKDGPTSMMT